MLFSSGKTTTEKVWYASYGSNLNVSRFACYIQGGKPDRAIRTYKGCDDKTMPAAEACLELPFALYFAGESKVWGGGGVAYVGPYANANKTKSKAYLVTLGQFEQIVGQENGLVTGLPVNIDEIREQSFAAVHGASRYDWIIYCGEYDNYPILTFTSSTPVRPYTKPSHAYTRMIASGLRDAYGLSAEAVASYLIDKPGIAGNYSRPELAKVIT